MGNARPHISAKREFAIEKQTVYQGPVLEVNHYRLQMPNGKVIECDIVERPESMLVLPVGQKDNVTPIEEYDSGAGVWQQAQNELREETGFRAGKLEKLLDLCMICKSARLYIQYAEALFVSRDLSCCFCAIEGLKIARSVGSKYNIWRV
jgi:hypothetical protein